MKWNEFVSFFQYSHEDDNELNNLRIEFQGKKEIEPSLFTRFNVHFLQSIEVYEKKKTVFIYPNNYYFLSSLLLFKSLQELNSGDTLKKVNPNDYYKVGQKYCLGKAVFSVYSVVPNVSVMFDFKTRKGGLADRKGFMLNDRTFIFSRASQDAELTSKKVFDAEYEKITSTIRDPFLIKLQRNKNMRNNTMIVVGPVKKYIRLFKNCKINNCSL